MEPSIESLIAKGEGATLEFKSSARWNFRAGKGDAELELATVKSVASFMNAEGGTLLIGISDDGEPLGLANDLKLISKRNRDGYELWLGSLLMKCLGKMAAMNARISFADLDGKDVCRIDVRQSPKPVFVNAPKSKNADEFYVRMNNQTQRLSTRELLEYEKDRWPK